jgi:hypothetical protein
MMLALVITAALAQGPLQQVAVVHASKAGVAPKRVTALLQELLEIIRANGLEPVATRGRCEDRACLTNIGRELRAEAIVSVTFASVGRDTVVDIECIKTSDEKTLAQETFTVREGKPLSIEATTFMHDVMVALRPRPKVAPERETVVAPPLTPLPAPVLVEEKSHALGIALTSVAAAILVTAAVLAGLAVAARADAYSTRDFGGTLGYAHTFDEAAGLTGRANALAAGSLSCGIAALVLGAGAIWAW